MTCYPNLLPKSVIAARARRARIRQWTAVIAMEAVLLSGACLFLRLGGSDPVAGMGSTIKSTVEQIDLMTGAIATARAELADLERRVAVATEVSRQPDWSIVLAMLAKKGAGAVKVDSCDLTPAAPGESGGQVGYRLTVVGVCPTQSALTRFVKDLEETGAFSRIKVVETRRAEDQSQSTAVRFTIESWLEEGPGS